MHSVKSSIFCKFNRFYNTSSKTKKRILIFRNFPLLDRRIAKNVFKAFKLVLEFNFHKICYLQEIVKATETMF